MFKGYNLHEIKINLTLPISPSNIRGRINRYKKTLIANLSEEYVDQFLGIESTAKTGSPKPDIVDKLNIDRSVKFSTDNIKTKTYTVDEDCIPELTHMKFHKQDHFMNVYVNPKWDKEVIVARVNKGDPVVAMSNKGKTLHEYLKEIDYYKKTKDLK